jgi:serine protease Do
MVASVNKYAYNKKRRVNMEGTQLPKNEFVREKIKDKPYNKKRIAIRLLMAIACGIAFGAAASIVFALLLPRLQSPQEAAQEESQTTEEESEQPATETQTEEETESEAEPMEVVVDLTIEDYQKIQNLLYAIGTEVNKSMVTITSVTSDTDIFHNSYEAEGQGAGVIISDTGSELLILTERKLISDASEIRVTFADDAVYSASLVKADGNTGIAILSVGKSTLSASTRSTITCAEIGRSAGVGNGTLVIALGNLLGTNDSILTGNITSTDNEITTEDRNYSIFTTDIVADKNGSGVLVNTEGQIIGIVMQDYSASSSENILTAVAVSDLEPVIEMLCAGEDIPYLGLHVSTVTDKIAADYDIPKGVYIREVSMDSPAMNAGLQSGDVIVKVNGENVSTANGFSSKVLGLTPGDTVSVVVKRKGASAYSEITVSVEVGILQ